MNICFKPSVVLLQTLDMKICAQILIVHLSVPRVEIIPKMKKTFETEVTTIETKTWKKTIIGVDSRQDVTRASKIRPSQTISEREGGDDWFVLFDSIREKPVLIPRGTFYCQRACIHYAEKVS